mgnify:CR=1 FL=1
MTSGNGFSISLNLIDCIKKHVPKEGTILEFGSGEGTKWLVAEGYNLVSIEQNALFLNLYHNNYCHAPLKDGWYDLEILHRFLENKEYDAILIDGPAAGKRMNILEAKIDFNKIIFVDDIDRPADRDLFSKLSEGKKSEDFKSYGVIFND